jgi:hypothetical protein
VKKSKFIGWIEDGVVVDLRRIKTYLEPDYTNKEIYDYVFAPSIYDKRIVVGFHN